MDRWNVVQHELIPELEARCGAMTPKRERVIHILEWVRIEEFTAVSWCGVGRPPFERAWLANAFVAKAVLGVTTTVGLLDRLMNDPCVAPHLWFLAVPDLAFRGHLLVRLRRVCRREPGRTSP